MVYQPHTCVVGVLGWVLGRCAEPLLMLCCRRDVSRLQQATDIESVDVEQKYKKMYEEGLNPFAAFSNKVRCGPHQPPSLACFSYALSVFAHCFPSLHWLTASV